MNLTVSNTNRILRSGNGPTVEYTGQDPIQVNNATHIISLNSAFSAQFAESGVEAKVDELSSCCEQVHSSISSLETQVSSLSSSLETLSGELPDLEPYATKDWVEDQGYLTQVPDGYLTKGEAEVTYQPIGDYLVSGDFIPDQAETYLVTGGNWIDISADDVNRLTTISVTGLDDELQSTSGALKNELNDLSGQLTAFSSTTLNALADKKDKQSELHLSDNGKVVTALHQSVNGDVSADFGTVETYVPSISSDEVIAPQQTLTDNMVIQVLSGMDLSGDKNHYLKLKGGTYRFPDKYELASGINQTNTFLTQSAFNSYSNEIGESLTTLYDQDTYLSGRIDNLSAFTMDLSDTVESHSATWNKVNPQVNTYVTTKSANIDLATSLVTANEANWSDTTYTVYTTSSKWEDASNKVRNYSAQWAKNDGNTAVNNWVIQNSASLDMISLGYLTNEANWNSTYYTVMTNSASWSAGTSFPITSQSGSTKYTLSVSSNALWFTTASGPAGATTRFDVKGISYQAYPSTDVSASWYNIIKASETPSSNCYCVVLNNSHTAADLKDYSAFDRLTVIHGQDYGPDCHLYWNGNTKVFPSGLYCNMAKIKDDQNNLKWTFLNSGWTFDYYWDWD